MTGTSDQTCNNASDTLSLSNIVTVAEAARTLGKSERTIRRMIAAGKLPIVKVNGATCIQLTTPGTRPDTSGNVGTGGQSGNDMSGVVSDRVEQALRDQIRHLEAENARLWDLMHTMLPAPAHSGQTPGPARRGISGWWILAAAIVAAAAGTGGYWLWMNW